MPHVEELFVYPIKSTRPIAIKAAEVTSRGFAGDRRWMLVDASDRFLSQRVLPRLALVEAIFTREGLLVRAPRMPPLEVRTPSKGAEQRPVRLFNDAVDVAAAAGAADAWFSCFLGQPVRLVYQPEDSHRPVDPRYRVEPTDEASLADGFPVLLTTTGSLAELNSRLAAPLPMNRFRPNLVLGGCEAFEEDTWTVVQIGTVQFHVVKPCKRCAVTTVDQATGKTGTEPLRALGRLRQHEGGVYFGQNLTPAHRGHIQVGDRVEVRGGKPAFWNLR